MRNFADVLYDRRSQAKSNIILTIDTNFGKLPPWLKKSKVSEFGRNWAAVSEALAVYEKYIIETISPYICAIMPKLSSYLQYGAYGLRALECTIVQALKYELPVIIDARIAEYNHNQNVLAGNAVIGRVSSWEGEQPSNLHAHAVSIIPYYGEKMIDDYVALCEKMRRGLVVIANKDTDFKMLDKYSEELVGLDVDKSGLIVMLQDDSISLLNDFESNNLSAFVKFPDIYDAIELQQDWTSYSKAVKQKTFVCLGSEIDEGVNNAVSESIIKDEEIIKAHFSGCIEKAQFYQKLFFI